ncbi:MAG: hypothetical protein HY076_07600 [Candidatus Eisenbacteria bacterium]|uniref:Uncharacterized protein n=1 Tax=Eiseniibacteriota bacterium TaxID=2212470 RepID=A0A9D6LB00_UNCEI|nr:hypothetical protein [Candidatus Eisenbacteria bacterium]MBI3540122.1 hypothetical protein [Candidatus Eisenbacteria bacterium]
MARIAAALFAACLMFEIPVTAARAEPAAVEPFRAVPLDPPARQSHLGAYATCITGAALVGLSFSLTHRADRAYAEYLVSTDPAQIDVLFDRAARYDHLSQASVLTGEALIAAGLYLRFIRRPSTQRVAVSLEPTRCAVSYRF